MKKNHFEARKDAHLSLNTYTEPALRIRLAALLFTLWAPPLLARQSVQQHMNERLKALENLLNNQYQYKP